MHRILVSTSFCEIMLIFTCFAFDLQPFYKNVAKIIHLRTRADVHMKGSYGYHLKRKVQNGACVHNYTDLIAAPKTPKDVSTIVSIATEFNILISFKA